MPNDAANNPAPRRRQITLSEAEQAAFLAANRKASLATLDQDGYPHLVAMTYGVKDGVYYMTSYAKAQKVMNIQRNPKVGLMIEAGGVLDGELKGVMVRGVCDILEGEDAVREAWGDHRRRRRPPAPPRDQRQRGQARRAQGDTAAHRQLAPHQARRAVLGRIGWAASFGRRPLRGLPQSLT